MSIIVNSRGDSPPRIGFFSESPLHPKYKPLDQPEAFVYSLGNVTLLSRRRLSTYNPLWQFADVAYNSSDDEGSMEEDELKPPVDDIAVDLFINRILLACTMNKEDEDSFGIDNPWDGIVEDLDYDNRPLHLLPTTDKQEWKKKMRKSRKISDGKKEKMPVPEVIGPLGLHLPLGTIRGYTSDGVPTVTMLLDVYRDTIMAEVDSLARRIYYFYNEELQTFDNIRVNAHKDSFFWHEKTKVLEKLLETKEAQIATLNEEKKLLQSRIDGEKKLKRQRRADKKQRRKAERTSQYISDIQESASGCQGKEGHIGE